MKKGSSVAAGKIQGLPGGRVTGSSRAGGPTEIMGMGGSMTQGSTRAGVNMAPVPGKIVGSTKPGMLKGGSKPTGTSKPNVPSMKGGKVTGSTKAAGKISQFHATRGASKL